MSHLPTNERSAVRPPTEPLALGHAGHVLVADGNTDSRERREAELRDTGVRVSVARTGFEAIVKATCHVPDLIVLHDTLPDLDAAETRRMIATCPVTAHIPVVTIRARGTLRRSILAQLRHRTA